MPQALFTYDEINIRGVARDREVAVAGHAQCFQALQKGLSGLLSGVLGDDDTADVEPHAAERVNQTQDIFVVGDAQVAPHFARFNMRGVDGNDNFHVVFELLQHTDFAVGLKAGKNARGMEVIKELAAELQIKFSAELGDSMTNLFRLHRKILLIIKTNRHHLEAP